MDSALLVLQMGERLLQSHAALEHQVRDAHGCGAADAWRISRGGMWPRRDYRSA
jgi:hypothetical protein